MMFIFRRPNSAYPSTQLMLSVCLALVTVPGLSSCNSQSDPEVSNGKPPASSGSALSRSTKSTTKAPALPKPAKPSAPDLNLPSASSASKAKLKIEGDGGIPPSLKTDSSSGAKTTSPTASPNIDLPAGLTKPDSPDATATGNLNPTPSLDSVTPSSSPTSPGTDQSAQPEIPTVNIPAGNITADEAPTGAGTLPSENTSPAPSAFSSENTSPAPGNVSSENASPAPGNVSAEGAPTTPGTDPAVSPSNGTNPAPVDISPGNIQPEAPAGGPDSASPFTEEASSLNEPIDPSLKLTPSTPSSAAESNEPAPPLGGNSTTGANNANNATGATETQPSPTGSNPSGLRQLEYKYNPSTGVYSTEVE